MEEMAISELKLEEAMKELETIIEDMNREDITLEDSFRDYEKGIALVKHCHATIDRVEKQMIELKPALED